MIPPANRGPELGITIHSWGDMEKRLSRWLRDQVAGRKVPKGGLKVLARLIPRPDNDYNPYAVSLAAGPSFGGDIEDRHLGYLPDGYLSALGFRTLHDLARRSGGELVATVTICRDQGTRWIELDIPDPDALKPAIERFMADPSHPPLNQLPQLLEGTAYFAQARWPEQRTDEVLAALALFETSVRRRRFDLAVDRYTFGGRTLVVRDADSGAHCGYVSGGHLYLDDERERDAVVAELRSVGVSVALPTSVHPAAERARREWATDAVPNAWVQARRGGPDFRPVSSRPDLHQSTFAQYNPTSNILYAEDDRLITPALIYASRLGLPVVDVVVPSRPWNLENEVWYSVRKDRTLSEPEPWTSRVELSRSARRLVPRGLFAGSTVRWTDGESQEPGESPGTFVAVERLVRERGELFGQHAVSDTVVPCRLCGRAALSFTCAISTGDLGYCQACLQSAQYGVVEDKQKAAIAVGELAAAEFYGMPMLESQLARLNIHPNSPVEPEQIDRLLLLRFGVRRGVHPWTHLLLTSGVAQQGIRTSRGTLMKAIDGHLCRSMQEKAVDDFFHQYGISHDLEPNYPVHATLNPKGLRRADWRLSDGTFVEMWGMPDDPVYAAKMREKHQLAIAGGLRLIGLTLRDLPRLPEIFAEWLTVTTPLPAAGPWLPGPLRSAKQAERRGDTRGGNAANQAARQERLARAALAVALQTSGVSRKAIAQKLATTHEVVKMLLRDGKFYANPDDDPARSELALEAAEAKEAGLTKSEFQASKKISSPKAQEAWRDADVLFGAQHQEWQLKLPPAPELETSG